VQASESSSPEFSRDEVEPGTVAVRVAGEVDLSSVEAMSAEGERAIAGDSPQLVVDLTACEFIDSSVLALLVELRKRLNSTARARFAVVANGQPLQVIKTTQLDREIPVFSSTDDAVGAVSG
jgi:anti-anti-sigma factor